MILSPVSSLQCIHTLLKLGYTIRRQGPASVTLERPGRIVVVPLGRVLAGEGLAMVLAAAGITPEAFAAAVGRPQSGEHGIAPLVNGLPAHRAKNG